MELKSEFLLLEVLGVSPFDDVNGKKIFHVGFFLQNKSHVSALGILLQCLAVR